MFLVIYIDYFHLYQPGEIDDIRGGIIFAFDISGTLRFSHRRWVRLGR